MVERTLSHMGTAGPARDAVHRHRARAAHPDPAGIAVRERGVERALDMGDEVENGLAGGGGGGRGRSNSGKAPPPPPSQPETFKPIRKAGSARTRGGRALQPRSAARWRCGTCTPEACPPPDPELILFLINRKHRRRYARTSCARCAGWRTA